LRTTCNIFLGASIENLTAADDPSAQYQGELRRVFAIGLALLIAQSTLA
jgi:hypothetical protein